MDQGSFLERYGRVLLIGIAILLVVAIGAWYFLFYEMRLTVATTPTSATVLIDGTDVTGQKGIKLKPGNHTVKVTLNDFVPFEQTIKASSSRYVSLPVTLNAVPHLQIITPDATTAAKYNATAQQLFYLDKTTGAAASTALQTSADSSTSSIPKPTALTSTTLSGVDTWLWAPNFSSALFSKNNVWSLYTFNRLDLLNQEVTAWPSNIGSASFNPGDTGQLAHFFAPSSDSQTLVQTNPLHTSATVLTNFRDSGISQPTVRWVGNGSDIVLQSKEGRLWRFVVYSKKLTAITQSESVADALPSPDGQTVLARETNGNLFLIGIDGTHKQTLSIQAPLSQIDWQQDSQALWVATTSNGSLSVTKYDVKTNTEAAYAIATNETVGTINAIAVSTDQSRLAIAGEKGLASVLLKPVQYPSVALTK